MTAVAVEGGGEAQALYITWAPPINVDSAAVGHYEVWVEQLMQVFRTSGERQCYLSCSFFAFFLFCSWSDCS